MNSEEKPGTWFVFTLHEFCFELRYCR